MKNKMIILTMGLMLMSCNEVKLQNCDVDVYHDSEISKGVRDQIRDDAFFEKNWNITFTEKNESNSIDRSNQHAEITYKMSTKVVDTRLIEDGYIITPAPYRYKKSRAYKRQRKARATCQTIIRVFSPDLKGSRTFKVEDSLNSNFSFSPFKDIQYESQEMCLESMISIVEKLPKCTLK